MSSESAWWKVIGVALGLLAIIVPAYIAYDTDDPPPPNPEKRLELVSLPGINPLRDLSAIRDNATISVTVEDETFDNLIISEAWFNNTGEMPILPSEYHQNLTVTVNEPWKIVTVENQGRLGKGIPLNWKRISDTSFEAEPALLNPGDKVYARVYLTNLRFSNAAVSEERIEPKVDWSARITNLRSFSKPPSDPIQNVGHTLLDMKGVVVILYGWALPFVIAMAIVFQAMYLYLLWRLELLQEWDWRSFGLLIGTSVISFVAAECLSTYLFVNFLTANTGVEHRFNAPPLVISAALLALLWWKARPETRKSPLEAG